MKCPNCNSTIEEQSLFCYMCGTRINSEPDANSTNNNSRENPEDSKNSDSISHTFRKYCLSSKLIYVLIGIIFLAMLYSIYIRHSLYNRDHNELISDDSSTSDDEANSLSSYDNTQESLTTLSEEDIAFDEGIEEIRAGKITQGYNKLYMNYSVSDITPIIENLLTEMTEAENFKDAYQLYSLVVEETGSNKISDSFEYNNLYYTMYFISNDYGWVLSDEVEMSDREKSIFADLDYYYEAYTKINTLWHFTSEELYTYDSNRILAVEEKLIDNQIISKGFFSKIYSDINELNGTWVFVGCVHIDDKTEAPLLISDYCSQIEISNGYYKCHHQQNGNSYSGYLTIYLGDDRINSHYGFNAPLVTDDIKNNVIYIENSLETYNMYEKISN